jgi:hypothetical protein
MNSQMIWLNIELPVQRVEVPKAKPDETRPNTKHSPVIAQTPENISKKTASSTSDNAAHTESPPVIDWSDAARSTITDHGMNSGTQFRQFGESSANSTSSNSPKPRVPQHYKGESERFEDGEVRIWTSNNCYLTSDNNGLHFREFTLGIPDRSGSRLTCVELKPSMPNGPNMFGHLRSKQIAPNNLSVGSN